MKNIIIITIGLILFAACQPYKSSSQDGIKLISTTEFSNNYKAESEQLIDVRTPQEFEEGHIENAENMDVQDLDTFYQQIQSLDKNKPVYVYCRSGVRSAKAAKIFKEQGFEKVYDIDGGYKAWSDNH